MISQYPEAPTSAEPHESPLASSATCHAADLGGSLETATLILDLRGTIRFCSTAAERMFGRRAGDLIGRSVVALVPDIPVKGKTPAYNVAYADFWFSDDHWRPFQGVDPDGHAFPIEVSLNTLRLDGKQRFLVALRHPFGHCATHAELNRLIEAVERSADVVVITDINGVIEYVNPVFEAITGFSRREALGRTPRIVKSGMHGPDFYAELWSTLRSGKEFRAVFVNRKKNGDIYYEEETIRPFVDALGQITRFVSTGRDVSERIHTLERLDFLANHDSLTGLPNRNLFTDRLRQALARAARRGGSFALLCLDLDQFKALNDRHGHAAGDDLLRTVALRLTQCVREEDTVARLGGDEFALILADIARREDVQKVLDKILAAVREEVAVEAHGVSISASIGVSVFPDDGDDACSLVARADRAMYHVKAAGGDGYRFFGAE